MADLYFSTLGNDTTGDGSQLNPYLTLTKCNTESNNNDVIEGSDGTYKEAAFVNIASANLTIQAENTDQAIIQNATTTTRILHTTQDDFTLKGIILDAENLNSGCITVGTNPGLNLTIEGGGFLNPTTNFIQGNRFNNLTLNGGWTAFATSLAGPGIKITYAIATSTVGAVSISDGAISIGDSTDADLADRRGIHIVASDLAGVSTEIFDVDVSLNIGTVTNVQEGIYVEGMESLNIYANTIDFIASLRGTGIRCELSAVDDTDTCNIYGNTITSPIGSTSGMGIQCGSNLDLSPTGVGSLKNARVFNNVVDGSNHGVFVGWITDARMYANTVTNTDLGCISKGASTCKITGNVIIDCIGEGALLAKGDTDSNFANNLAITNAGVTTPMMIAARVSGITNSIGTEWTNNILFNNGGTVTRFVNYVGSQTATFVNNNTYSNETIPANSWLYNAVQIADFAAWAAHAQTTGELNVDPEITGLDSGDYLARSASLLNGGANWGEEMYLMEDFLNYPWPAFGISIGAVQGTDNVSNPFACPNL